MSAQYQSMMRPGTHARVQGDRDSRPFSSLRGALGEEVHHAGSDAGLWNMTSSMGITHGSGVEHHVHSHSLSPSPYYNSPNTLIYRAHTSPSEAVYPDEMAYLASMTRSMEPHHIGYPKSISYDASMYTYTTGSPPQAPHTLYQTSPVIRTSPQTASHASPPSNYPPFRIQPPPHSAMVYRSPTHTAWCDGVMLDKDDLEDAQKSVRTDGHTMNVYQCLWDLEGSPCGLHVESDRSQMGRHLQRWHNISRTGSDTRVRAANGSTSPNPENHHLRTASSCNSDSECESGTEAPANQITCLWAGCGKKLGWESVARHIGSSHLGTKWVCSRCNAALSREDAWQRHVQPRTPRGKKASPNATGGPRCLDSRRIQRPGLQARPVNVFATRDSGRG
ncbi:hypothetical protein BJ138DRAFT_1142945 [Hygrophoropsis aurantiaca]|uniref:Uncharacterized protein n=1 Tax=Hygrophoropsis aurantiaca TaxID=72124 RepID=A0ACB8AQA5_9AGAM|nr:hypothetical protein BJ138DRAFT_1142945 [Hygrophoropsis aurantiaca]